ncbi:MAG: ATP-binding cassette domain-containing protein, partial [Actinobacteria bacterium]|nr:ATP-binding cassette domain-containing protein [Actinomycetota bacterium]
LSGGERQRIGVARALAADPPVLLMDEPFGAVDPVGRQRLQDEFLALQKRLGTTVMLVTHDVDEAVRMADRVAVLSAGAHVEQLADPLTVVARSASAVVTDLVARGKVARLLALGRLAPEDLLDIDAGGAPSSPVVLGAELGDVLATLLDDGGSSVLVVDRAGEPVGRADAGTVLRALQRLAPVSVGTLPR